MDEIKGKALLLNSESCGTANSELGYLILMQLLESLAEREDRPAVIILWNTAVKLLTANSPVLSKFKRLEERGVNIIAGRLCITELGIADNIAVGKTVGMGEILDIILHYDVVSL
jgi:hypothetical protein